MHTHSHTHKRTHTPHTHARINPHKNANTHTHIHIHTHIRTFTSTLTQIYTYMNTYTDKSNCESTHVQACVCVCMCLCIKKKPPERRRWGVCGGRQEWGQAATGRWGITHQMHTHTLLPTPAHQSVMAHMWIRRNIRMDEHMHESWHTCGWMICEWIYTSSRFAHMCTMNESRHTCKCIMSHITYEWVMTHRWMSEGMHMCQRHP